MIRKIEVSGEMILSIVEKAPLPPHLKICLSSKKCKRNGSGWLFLKKKIVIFYKFRFINSLQNDEIAKNCDNRAKPRPLLNSV